MKAFLNLRYVNDKRAQLFEQGLKKHGFKCIHKLCLSPSKDDIMISWNRIGPGNKVAQIFKEKGLKVLIAENASFGNDFAGERWFHIARDFHNTQGCFYIGDHSRWDDLNIELKPFRTCGETIILPQRGIGSDPVRMPHSFTKKALKEYGGRVRGHPGRKIQTISLEDDLHSCGRTITWGSGAAVKALMMGIPCISYYKNWIGQQSNSEKDRLRMFRELIWANWTHREIENGYAFDCLLNSYRLSNNLDKT